jgi:predicted nucleotidyltransferase
MDMTGKKLLFKAYHGSHLYGLNTPKSDTDFKGIVIPSKAEIKTNSAPQTCYDDSTHKAKNQKNTTADTDSSYFTLKAFLRLCAEGQTVAVEMLFTPRHLWVASSPEWEFLVANRDKLIHKNMGSFFNLARKQAYKYSIKGERIEANKIVLAWANQFNENERLEKHLASLETLVAHNGHLLDTEKKPLIKFVTCIGPRGEDVLHLEVSNRKNPLTVTFKHFKKGLEKVLSQYGHRALQANQMGGADFKALSHAVRVGYEALELLQTHQLTFPLAQKDEVMAMKQGQRSFPEIEAKIEALLLEIRDKEQTTTLPAAIDQKYWDQWLQRQYDLWCYPKWWVWFKKLWS